MAFKPHEQAPPDGPVVGTPLYLVNQRDASGNATGIADFYLYIPNGSIGCKIAANVELFKTTLASLIAGTPGAVTITPSIGSEPQGDGGLVDSGVNAKFDQSLKDHTTHHNAPVKGGK